jgi:hypothetical protein
MVPVRKWKKIHRMREIFSNHVHRDLYQEYIKILMSQLESENLQRLEMSETFEGICLPVWYTFGNFKPIKRCPLSLLLFNVAVVGSHAHWVVRNKMILICQCHDY